jgi:choline dehydrogenase
MARPNLEVLTDARVTKVVVEGGRAAGVRYLLRGTEETAYAQGEVILSGGAVGSPHLLMLSGIGPADHLREAGIPVLVDSPGVGANLSDHPVVPAQWATPRVPGLWEKSSPVNLIRWRMRHSGPLTSNVAESGGFSRTRPSLPAPDLQWHALPTPFVNQGLGDPAVRAFTLLVTLVDVGSRGRVWLRSDDPRHKPAIDPAYLSDSTDIAPLVEGVRMARDFATAASLAKVCAKELAPGPGVKTDAEVREWIRRELGTLYHPVGTCAMGGDSRLAAAKLTSVVDPELRVRGVEGLRVVDASVMPTVPRGNTNAPTIALAERAADLIIGRAPLEPTDPALEPEPLPAETR